MWLGIQLEGWLTIVAVRLEVFRTLMETRAATVSARHVQALNQIDVDFYGAWPRVNDKVRESWKELRNHLSDAAAKERNFDGWAERTNELRVTMLHTMSSAVGFELQRDDIKRNVYSPVAHGDLERDQELIRKGVAEVLTNRRAISVVTHAGTAVSGGGPAAPQQNQPLEGGETPPPQNSATPKA